MKRRAIRFLVLLWLGWYLSGPLFQTLDLWDSPQEEMADIARNAGGAVTLIAAVVCIGMALFRELQDRCLCLATTLRQWFAPLDFETSPLLTFATPAPTHSPPLLLRI